MHLISSHQGDPSRPHCVFLHGFLGAKEDWQEMWSLLSESFFCLGFDLFDLPGHGSSPALSTDYLNLLSNEIARTAAPNPILIGYSLGGRLALQLAQADPSRYSHVIALSAHPGISDEKERQARLSYDLEWTDKLKHLEMDAFLTEWYDQPLFRSLRKRPDLLQSILEKRKTQDPKKMADVMSLLSPARQNAIGAFHPRTLFLYGDEDEKYQKLYSMIPKEVCVRKIELSGHIVHLENPKACAMRIQEWLEEQP
jgi:2-succinyl-6-hydroxy-2,4-cyclohexadiene-1-carboxylate synthase